MILNAVIESDKGGALVIGLPHSAYGLYEKLQSAGIDMPPNRIPLTDNEGDSVRVKLYGEDEVGRHLTLLLSKDQTLADANTLAFVVDAADSRIRQELEQNILQDRYSGPTELYGDIKRMLQSKGPVTESFYFPLTGRLYEYGDDYNDESETPVTNQYLQYFEDEIRAALQREQSPELGDMAQYMARHPGVKEKLVSAEWDVEYVGSQLYGKVTAYLNAPFTGGEKEAFRDEIVGQAADGLGEGFEQRPIETGDGDLYVSLWDSNDGYFVYDENEFRDYLAQSAQQMT